MTDLSAIENKEDFMNRPSDVRNYEVFKKEFDEEIHRAADSYVRIGYLLMEARDTGILQGSGYATMSDFAKAEYGLSPDQTSRFISVCEKFGDGEGHLKSEYEKFGQTKLIEMLSLPESVTESISPELTREEIRDIKNEVKEEQKITPLEVAMEPVSMPENFDDLDKFAWCYFEEHPDKYVELAGTIDKATPGEINEKTLILETFAPTGIAVLQARIPRMGRLLLSFTGDDKNPALVFVRDDRREEVDWHTLYEALEYRVSSEETWEDDPKVRWSKTYGKEYPGIAPAQISKEPQSKSQTNFAENQPKKEENEKPEKEETRKVSQEAESADSDTRKVSQEAESGNPESDKVSQTLEKTETEASESKSQTNFDESCKLPASEQSKSETEIEVIQKDSGEGVEQVNISDNLPFPDNDDIYRQRVKRAASDLEESLNLFVIGMPGMETAEDISKEYMPIITKIREFQNMVDMWRQSK